ncbi:DUF2268 domain-containing protein [Brevibacterium sp. Marseille-P9724]|uniref:DUF2268 domain-containing protein n=1 Tax=Brevibacterium sp. Marseille-P9724 TaxID=2614125 RepID=UPI00125F1368|nr:DUF2268 domain-containing putative Zn-dependent protease [Brevibacterium sp. Marseille-P9724]
MTISMIDSAAKMRAMLDCPPERWQEAARRLWEPMSGMYFFNPGELDLAAVHRQNFGFGPEAPRQQVVDALRRLEKAAAWHRIEAALAQGAADLAAANPSLRIPDVTALLVLGDPTNRHFMDEIKGLSAFGGISGYIAITLWPTDEVLNRLEAIALHELHHNVRYSPGGIMWNPQTVTVGEHVIAEGLADLFAAHSYGDRGYTHFVADETRTSDEVLQRVVHGLEVTGMQDFAAWVLGDATARLFGSTPVGLPTGAGYAAGTRIVQTYLDTTSRTAAECVTTPAEEILDVALPQLGLERHGN